MKTGHAEQHRDLARSDIARKPRPKMHHRRAAAIIAMQAGPPQLQQAPPALLEGCQIIFILGIKLSGRPCPLLGQKPIDADDLIALGPAGVMQQQVIDMCIEAVDLAPGIMIDHGPIRAQFGHEDIIAQTLCGMQIGAILCQAKLEMAIIDLHDMTRVTPVAMALAGPDPLANQTQPCKSVAVLR